MASIVGKKRGTATYYYLVESARVDGKPRIVSQQYLGSASEVMARLSGAAAGEPVRTQHKSFGDLAAVWSVLQRLDVAGVIDAALARRSDAVASVGTYIALATANRIVAPCSKLAFADWWDSTAGPRFTRVSGAALDHRRFWKAMDRLDEPALPLERLAQGEARVVVRGVEIEDPDDLLARLDEVTAEDVQAVARDLFEDKRLYLALVGPFDDPTRFEQLLGA